jgi:hypothetical protein
MTEVKCEYLMFSKARGEGGRMVKCGLPSNSNAHYLGEGQGSGAHEFVPAPPLTADVVLDAAGLAMLDESIAQMEAGVPSIPIEEARARLTADVQEAPVEADAREEAEEARQNVYRVLNDANVVAPLAPLADALSSLMFKAKWWGAAAVRGEAEAEITELKAALGVWEGYYPGGLLQAHTEFNGVSVRAEAAEARIADLEALLRRYSTMAHDERCEGKVGPSGKPRTRGQFPPSMCFCSERMYQDSRALLAAPDAPLEVNP